MTGHPVVTVIDKKMVKLHYFIFLLYFYAVHAVLPTRVVKDNMNPEALRAAIETAHVQLYPDRHAMLFGMRKVELGELIVETVDVCEAKGFSVGHQHFVATLSTPKYTQLGQLFDKVPDAWALIDPQTVEPEDFVTNLDLFRLAFIEAFPEAAAELEVASGDTTAVPTATGGSNIVQLRPEDQDEDKTRTALGQLGQDPFATEDTAEPIDKMEADEARLRLWFRDVLENHPDRARELIQQRRNVRPDELVSSHRESAGEMPFRQNRLMPHGALYAALEIFSADGKDAAVEFFKAEFLYAVGGASPALLALIRHRDNRFLWDLLRGLVDDADYGRYMGILLEIVRDVLKPAA